jgi:DMSO/TMAO reductase YedYZ molybdopterin-dependent catalytic subunit
MRRFEKKYKIEKANLLAEQRYFESKDLLNEAPNVKTVQIFIPNENVLSLIVRTPALSNLVRTKLKVGDNIERVNHYQFSQLMRMFPIAGAQVKEI